MNIQQAVKMAWKSIWGKKGRSALTMLGIIIGIAAVMTIVSAINGYTEKTMEQYEAMGSNKLTVNIWNYLYDEDGNSLGQDYFPALYDYCNGIKEYVLGVTPQAYCNATVVYGTKSTANMSYNYDENGNLTGDVPPSIYYGSTASATTWRWPPAGTCPCWTSGATSRYVCWGTGRQRSSSTPRTPWARCSSSTGRALRWWGSMPPALPVKAHPPARSTMSSFCPTPPAGCWAATHRSSSS